VGRWFIQLRLRGSIYVATCGTVSYLRGGGLGSSVWDNRKSFLDRQRREVCSGFGLGMSRSSLNS